MDRSPLPQDETITKRRKFIVNFLYFTIIFGLSVLFVRFALPKLWAFVIALAVVLLLRKPALAINRHWKIDYKTGAVLLVLLFYATIGLAVTLIILAIVNKIIDIVGDLPGFITNTVNPAITKAFGVIDDNLEKINESFNLNLSINLDETVASAVSTLTGAISSLSSSIISGTTGIAVSVSTVLLNTVICIVSTAFGLMDYDLLTGWTKNQLSPRRSDLLTDISTHLGKVIGKYILSYGLIMLITYAELSAGLIIIMQDKKALMIAAIIAVFDILPIIGSGLFLFPWAVIALFSGNIPRGIGLLILWFVLIIVRNIIEPRIVGKSVGMHPLVTLFSMIAGEFIYGGIGILLCPVTLALIQTLNTAGVIHIYKVTEIPEETPSKLSEWISKPFQFVADWVAKGFSWVFRLIFKAPPHNIEKDIEEMKALKEEALADEDYSGSPEAAGGGPRTVPLMTRGPETAEAPGGENDAPAAGTDAAPGGTGTAAADKKSKKNPAEHAKAPAAGLFKKKSGKNGK